jgi:hypothetical protein
MKTLLLPLFLIACTSSTPTKPKCWTLVTSPDITAGLVCRKWPDGLGDNRLEDCTLYGRPVSTIYSPVNVVETECQ